MINLGTVLSTASNVATQVDAALNTDFAKDLAGAVGTSGSKQEGAAKAGDSKQASDLPAGNLVGQGLQFPNISIPNPLNMIDEAKQFLMDQVNAETRDCMRAIGASPMHTNAFQHAVVSSQLVRALDYSTDAIDLGNLKEQTSKDPRDSMKDQINNFMGREIGSFIENAVHIYPGLAGRERELQFALMKEAYQSGQLALDESDPRIDQLMRAGVDPKNWTPSDNNRLQWSGPSQDLLRNFGITRAWPPGQQF
jgi:hypothetical protein